MNIFEKVSECIKKGDVVVFTGSGISRESGIPTFRGEDGLWQKYDPQIFASMPQVFFTFISSPRQVIDFISEIYQTFIVAEPNFAHLEIARLQQQGFVKSIITQNIDNLHQEAGCLEIIELHGNVYESVCINCGWKRKHTKDEIKSFIEKVKPIKRRFEIIKKSLDFIGRCPRCNMRLRPNVVFFGESLPSSEFKKAKYAIRNAQTLIIVGTSGEVAPASLLPYEAKKYGACIIEINPSPSFREIDDFQIPLSAEEAFKNLSKYI